VGAGALPAGRRSGCRHSLELLRNSDANSMERKEGDLVGRGGIYREPEGVPRKFFFSFWGYSREDEV